MSIHHVTQYFSSQNKNLSEKTNTQVLALYLENAQETVKQMTSELQADITKQVKKQMLQ